MEKNYSEAAQLGFHREATKVAGKIVNVLWAWTVPGGVSDLTKLISAAIKLGGLDPQTAKEFTADETKELGATLEAFRRLEMRTETREHLIEILAEHGITIEIPEVIVDK